MPLRKLSAGALVALVVAGCGSTASSSTSTGTSAPGADSRAAFIAKADALCKTARTRQGAVHGKANSKTTATQLVPLLRQQGQIAKSLATSLAALTPPVGDSAAVGRFEHAVSQLSVYSTALANSVHANHAYAARSLAVKLQSWRSQESLLAQGYGYKICGTGVSY